MKNKALTTNSWDDLVFENKNKNYGAYEVRKSYSQNVTTGLGVTVLLAVAMIMLPAVIEKLSGRPIIKSPDEPLTAASVITILPPPPIDQILPPVAPPPLKQDMNANLPPVVTPKEVDTVIPTNDEIKENLNSVSDGEGKVPDAPAVVAPVIPVAPPDENKVFLVAEYMPKYEGGMEAMSKFISKKIHFPASARRIGINGTVYVTFVINKDGKVINAQVIKGISDDCDKEAIRIVSLLDAWTPGMQQNKPVNVRMTLPIKFAIAE